MGRLQVVKRGTVPGAPGRPGDPGPPGSGMRSFYYPTSYGATGNGVADDQSALEDCFEAAAATGGIVIIDRAYGFSDKIKHYGGMEVWQIRPRTMLYVDPTLHLHPWELPIEPGLIAVGSGAWYQYGDGSDGSASANDNPGPIRGLAIDGRGIAGAGNGLFVMDAAQSSVYDLMVVYSAGHGIRAGRSQNCNFFNVQVGGCAGTGVYLRTLDGLDTQQGAGHLVFFGGHIHDNYQGVKIDMGAGTFFPPHDNLFKGTLIESGRNADLGPVKNAVEALAGQTQFEDVNITFGTNATDHEDDCCILIDNPTTSGLGSVSTVVAYRGGSIGGGGDGMTDAIRIKQTLAANELRLSDRIAWANVDNVICNDGINAGFSDPLISHTGVDVYITGSINKIRSINGGTLLNGYRKAWHGALFELPTGQLNGVDIVNGNVANVFVVKHADESTGRFSIDWNATQRYTKAIAPTTGNPAPVGTTLGTTVVAGDIWGVTGRWGIGGGYYRTCVLKSIATNQAVNLDWSTANYFLLAFSAGAAATSITFTPAVTAAGGALADWVPTRGQEIRLGISATSTGSVITWPSNITFDGTAPQPINGVLQFVDLAYDTGSSKWFEVSRSHQVAGATGDVSGPGSSVAGNVATFSGTTGKIIQDSGTALSALAPLASPAFTGNPTAPTQSAGNNSTRLATTAYTDAAVGAVIAAADAMVFKGVIDASTNPNYPAADRGHTYKVSVAGKIGGASGINVTAGDLLLCITDSTAAGTQAAVGANWTIAEANIDGAVTGPASSVNGNLAAMSGTSGKVITDSGIDPTTLAPKASPTFTGDPKAPTPAANDNDTSIATTQYVQTELTDYAGDTVTFTNKRITKRVSATVSTATLTINSDNFDAAKVTAQAAALSVAAPTGTPTAMQSLIFRLKDNGTARAITWDAAFRAIGVTLPTTTVVSKTVYVGCVWNADDSKWDVIAVAQEA